MKHLHLLLIGILLLLFSPSCQPSLEKRLKGKWLFEFSKQVCPEPVFHDTVLSDFIIFSFTNTHAVLKNTDGPLMMAYQVTPDSQLIMTTLDEKKEEIIKKIIALNKHELILREVEPSGECYYKWGFKAIQ